MSENGIQMSEMSHWIAYNENDPSRSYIISTMIFVTGLVTLLQTSIGCKLPLVQGGTISFLVPTSAILNLPQWKCSAPEILNEMSPENRTELWQIRMRELSGAIAVAALFQVIVGFGGIIGYLLKFIIPLTIVPTVSLVGRRWKWTSYIPFSPTYKPKS